MMKQKDPEFIAVLKYGLGNNFTKFKEHIFKVASKEYGVLGKLIHQGAYYIPPTLDKSTYCLLDPELTQMG
jgi:hypothetical protein